MAEGKSRRAVSLTDTCEWEKLARPEGFEPPAPKFVVWCSIQLSYGRAVRRMGDAKGRDIRGWAAERNPRGLRLAQVLPRASAMRAISSYLLCATVALSACSTPGGPYPSLQPRAGELVDPRLPVDRPMNDRPVTPTLASRSVPTGGRSPNRRRRLRVGGGGCRARCRWRRWPSERRLDLGTRGHQRCDRGCGTDAHCAR